MPCIKTDGLPSLPDYQAAHKYWQDKKQVRGYLDTDPKPLGPNKKRGHMNIRKTREGTIACRLYRTDVLEYHEDGLLTIRAYPSMSTHAFVHRIAPEGITPFFLSSTLGYCVGLAREELGRSQWGGRRPRFYQVEGSTIELERQGPRAEWEIISGTTPFEFPILDRETTREALAKHPMFKDFSDWVHAYAALRKEPETYLRPFRSYGRKLDYRTAVEMMEAREWTALCKHNEFNGKRAINQMRRCIYQLEGVSTTSKTKDYVDDWGGLKTAVAAHRRYDWL
jgi:hypothetical protein